MSGSEAPAEGASALLRGQPVIVCMGSGGVGKTTTSAALAIAAARRGRRVAVLTVDPARRLADALGLSEAGSEGLGARKGLGNEPVKIMGPWSGELWGVMLDPGATFDDLIREHAADAAQAEAVLGNRLYRNLTSSLSGTNEYMAAERLRSLHLDQRFDLVVVDTPPSQHALDLLDSPGRLSRFVDHRLYRSILAPRRGVLRAISAAAQLAARTIGKVVGTALLDDVIDFFAAFEGMDEGFRRRADDVEELLTSPATAYVVITAARRDSIGEAGWLVEQLNERDRAPDAVIVNRMTPDFAAEFGLNHGDHSAATDHDESADVDPLAVALVDAIRLRSEEDALVDELIGSNTAGAARPSVPAVVKVDEQLDPVADLDGLVAMADALGSL